MTLLIVIAMLSVSTWGVVGTFRRLRRTRAGFVWWLLFVALALVGLTAGWWLALRFEYEASPGMRLASFPMPLESFRLIEDHWIGSAAPPYVRYPGLVANILTVAASALPPLLVASKLAAKRRGLHETSVA